MKPYNREAYKTAEDGANNSIPAGIYFAKITSATDNPEKERLELEFDITQGDFMGYASETYQRAKFWPLRAVRSYKENAKMFFNGFVTAVEASNPGYKWDWSESALVGKQIGIVIGEREYVSRTNEKKDGIEIAQIRSIDAIRKGEIKVPAKKLLSEADKAKLAGTAPAPAGFYAEDSEEPPF